MPHCQTTPYPPGPCHREFRTPDWQQALPAEWRHAAIAPHRFDTWRDYEIDAARTVGFDAEDKPCFCRHAFALDTLRSDDDDEFYAAVVYGEEVRAWRLSDGRWLVWRSEYQEGCRPDLGEYSFSDRMPR